ncbi:MAG: DUF4389 domain-containing protein [Chromatiales bacterium]|nr:DUF4389 domain-containing protein [Chromatiales bacterium]
MSELTNKEGGGEGIWIRALYMLLFVLLYSVAEFVMVAVVLVQFGYRAINDASHPRLLSLGASISRYIYQVLRYLSFNTEIMPYPFSEWPEGEPSDD